MNRHKIIISLLLILTTSAFNYLQAETEYPITQSQSTSDPIKKIESEDFKKLIDNKQSMLILDARKKNMGGMIPGAKSLPYNSGDMEMKELLQNVAPNTMIIVYCSNIHCPVGGYLAKRLTLLGYTNVYRYPDGLAGWVKLGYPTDPTPKN